MAFGRVQSVQGPDKARATWLDKAPKVLIGGASYA